MKYLSWARNARDHSQYELFINFCQIFKNIQMPEKKPIKILLTGGGTGGHITPLLAIISQIKKLDPNIKIFYVGRKQDINAYFSGVEVETRSILTGKLRRYFSWLNFSDLIKAFFGVVQSLLIIWRYKPNLLFAKGGYVSVPAVLAARILHLPVIAHESDVIIGLANKISARWAKYIAVGFEPKNYIDISQKNLIFTGNPIRDDFINIAGKEQKSVKIGKNKIDRQKPILLITGASQGAHRINELVGAILPDLLQKMFIIHISGRGDYNWLESEKKKLTSIEQSRYHLYSFLADEMAAVMNIADLVISRSSASLLSELAVLKKPAIIIPLSTAASNHQWHNAKIFERAGAICLIDERKATPPDLKEAVLGIINNSKKLKELSENIAKFSHPEAAKRLAELILEEAKKE